MYILCLKVPGGTYVCTYRTVANEHYYVYQRSIINKNNYKMITSYTLFWCGHNNYICNICC